MSDIAPLSRPNPAAYLANARVDRPVPSAAQPQRGSDQLELSDAARLLSKAAAAPDVRHDLIARIQSEIAAGTYETPEKIDAAVEGLAEDLR